MASDYDDGLHPADLGSSHTVTMRIIGGIRKGNWPKLLSCTRLHTTHGHVHLPGHKFKFEPSGCASLQTVYISIHVVLNFLI